MSNINHYPKRFNHKLDLKNSDKIKTPSIIGCFVSDESGKTILTFEIAEGALEFYIKRNIANDEKRRNFDVELISMFLSAISKYSQEVHSKEMVDMNLSSNSIKMKSFFCFNKFFVTFFVAPEVDMLILEEVIKSYFKDLFLKNKENFDNFSKTCFDADKSFDKLCKIGNKWIYKLNFMYESYLEKHSQINCKTEI